MSNDERKLLTELIDDLDFYIKVDAEDEADENIFEMSSEEEREFERISSLSAEEHKKELIAKFGIEAYEAYQERCRLTEKSSTVDLLLEGVRFLIKEGRTFLEQTLDGIVAVNEACHITVYTAPTDQTDKDNKLASLQVEGVQVAPEYLNVKQDGHIAINFHWFDEKTVPHNAPGLDCRFLETPIKAIWTGWDVGVQTQQLLIESCDELMITEAWKECIVRTHWDTEGNVLTVELTEKD